ncbi:unnamed protein product [Blepharisma stoltei]|uniref:Reverse transcriptase domain-containing protein n=1 Tax=Blepharisma stoltei TaxID=1481888 RepID=A0AAU9JJ23_9CILI|nr:unnamed protein product [Blepharisma stoltei]
MAHKSTTDQIFTLDTIIDCRTANNKPTWCAFLDLRKAFDSVPRRLLLQTMMKRGVEGKTINMISAMMKDEWSSIIMNDQPQKWIHIQKGVRQGGCVSPLAFNFIPNELAIRLKQKNYGVQLGPDVNIGLLLYADDIVLISESKVNLQKLCHEVEEWAREFKLTINEDKSEVMCFNEACKGSVRINGNILKVSNNFRYLGFIWERG